MSNSISNEVSHKELPLVINTRPVERAASLTEHLQSIGFEVLNMPMLALQARDITNADIDTMRHWLAGRYQALVIVSPTAAESGLKVWQALAQEENKNIEDTSHAESLSAFLPSPIIAVGDATAAVLQAANKTVLQPSTANNEGMLAMPEIAQLQADDSVLIWRGLGGRRLLVDTLQARGIHLDSIAWYERMMPKSAVNDYLKWAQGYSSNRATVLEPQLKPIVIISSGTAFEHWVIAVQQAKASIELAFELADFRYIVLGVRLANMIASQQLEYCQVEDLSPDTIAAAITS